MILKPHPSILFYYASACAHDCNFYTASAEGSFRNRLSFVLLVPIARVLVLTRLIYIQEVAGGGTDQ